MSKSFIEKVTLAQIMTSSTVIVLTEVAGAPRRKKMVLGASPLPTSHPLRPPSTLKVPLHPFRILKILKAPSALPDRIEVMTLDSSQGIEWATRMRREGVSKSFYRPTYDSTLGKSFGDLEGQLILFLKQDEADFVLAAEGSYEDASREEELRKLLQRGEGGSRLRSARIRPT